MVIGLYGIAPDVDIWIQDFAKPVTICFFFLGGPGVGHFRVDLRVVSDSGFTASGSSAEGDLLPGRNRSAFAMAIEATFPGPGKYRAELLTNGVVQHWADFELSPPQPIAKTLN